MSDTMRIGTTHEPVADAFRQLARGFDAPSVLELGTLRWEATPTHHQNWVPNAGHYVMSDVSDGLDVDVVADAHDLAPFADAQFDLVIACSVWEHLRLPWVAAQALVRVMAPGGVALIATHQTFPIHGYPDDFTRWTTAGLAAMFTWAGLETVTVDYAYPAQIVPPPEVTRWNPAAPAFLNVEGVWRRPMP